jgi:hypothetical protein
VSPGDEQRHPPGTEELWNESYYLDFVNGSGDLAGYVRIGLYPNLGVTWWTAMVVGAGRPVVASVAYDLPALGGPGLSLSASGVDITASVIQPLASMTVSGTAPAVIHPDAVSVYAGGPGEPTTVGFDLAWTTDGVPYHYDLTTRYEVPCLVDGTVTVAGEEMAVRGQGQRDHSWGVRDWWAFGWCWAAARLDDGTRVHVADIRIPGHPLAFGYLQPPGGGVVPVAELRVTEVLGPEGMPSSAAIELEPGGLTLEVAPVAFGPLVLTAADGRTSRFPRAVARFVAGDGRTGSGWIEWCQTDGEPVGR